MGTQIINDQFNEAVVVEEDTSSFLVGTLLDASGNVIMSPTSITLTLMEKTTRKVINSVQDKDILSDLAGGILVHHMIPADNPIILPETAEGAYETHLAELSWTWPTTTPEDGKGKTTYEFKVERCFVPVT